MENQDVKPVPEKSDEEVISQKPSEIPITKASTSDEATTSGQNCDESESQDAEQVVTMLEVLKDEEELEENALAVLGASDEKHCSYYQGYVYRQALYSCVTCRQEKLESEGLNDETDGDRFLAGVCLACANQCHSDHQLVELYTKRNFRCDCGNSKFKSQCKEIPNRNPLNDGNKYNQNFKGLYCSCSRPYPDPEDPIDDDMIQCIVCEDWFHARHVGANVPDGDAYSEMICIKCVSELDFLRYYPDINTETSSNRAKDTQSTDKPKESEVLEKKPLAEEVGEEKKEPSLIEKAIPPVDSEAPDSGHESNDSMPSCSSSKSDFKTSKSICLLKQGQILHKSGPLFMDDGWRKSLCKCENCLSLYYHLKCEYLLNEQDDVHYYEQIGKEKSIQVSSYDKGLAQMKNMDRVQQIEMIHGYNFLKENLAEFLKKYQMSGKVVREEDIKEFFDGLKNKRQKTQPSVIPHFCR